MNGLIRATPFVLQGVGLENCFLNGVCNERIFPLIPCRKRQSMSLRIVQGPRTYLL